MTLSCVVQIDPLVREALRRADQPGRLYARRRPSERPTSCTRPRTNASPPRTYEGKQEGHSISNNFASSGIACGGTHWSSPAKARRRRRAVQTGPIGGITARRHWHNVSAPSSLRSRAVRRYLRGRPACCYLSFAGKPARSNVDVLSSTADQRQVRAASSAFPPSHQNRLLRHPDGPV